MIILVKGVEIKLTKEQVKKIKDAERKTLKTRLGVEGMLKSLGFIPSKFDDAKDCYEHERECDWHVEIIQINPYPSLWAIGEGLKCIGGFPGGYRYDDMDEFKNHISEVLTKKI